jgi:Domain of unknown function (DUF1905)
MGDDGRVTFRGRVRYWDEAAGKGLAVVDVPADLVERLGGRRQYRVAGTLGGAPFTGSGMLVAGGGYCLGVSQAALKAARAAIGDEVEVSIAKA